jgi:outer membrane protein assembly factor BamD
MKKQFLPILMLCLMTALGCASTPKPAQTGTDVEIFDKAMAQYRLKNYIEAIPIFEELRDKYPISPYAITAELRLGDCHYKKEEFIEAAHFYDNFRRLHPSNAQVDYSIYMRGMCAYQQILSCDRDQSYAEEASEQFQQLFELFPQSPYTGSGLMRLSEARHQLAAREIFVADFYMRKLNYKGAIERYNRALKRYPNQVKEDEVLLKIGEATIRDGDERRGKKILEFLVKKFPDSSAAPQAKKIIENPATALKEIPWVTRNFN